MTQHVGTRISAQVRSHAQKVLKDYSPNNDMSEMDESDGEGVRADLLSQQPYNDTMTMPKDNRTAEAVGGADAEAGSNEGLLNLNL